MYNSTMFSFFFSAFFPSIFLVFQAVYFKKPLFINGTFLILIRITEMDLISNLWHWLDGIEAALQHFTFGKKLTKLYCSSSSFQRIHFSITWLSSLFRRIAVALFAILFESSENFVLRRIICFFPSTELATHFHQFVYYFSFISIRSSVNNLSATLTAMCSIVSFRSMSKLM